MAFQGLHVAVVIPAFDEEALIGRAIAAVPAFVDAVVVVDDASRDRTGERARAVSDPRLRVLEHAHNRGVGAAIATGTRWAFAHGADAVAVMAGDAQMDPADLPALLGPIADGSADYVKGNRLAYPGARRRMPVARWVGNHVLSCLTRIALGSRAIRDSQCGYTALSRRGAVAIDLDSIYPRYGYPNDVCARVLEAGLAMAQPVVRPVYGSEKSGITLRTALVRIPMLIARLLARRLGRGVGSGRERLRAARQPVALPEGSGAPRECA